MLTLINTIAIIAGAYYLYNLYKLVKTNIQQSETFKKDASFELARMSDSYIKRIAELEYRLKQLETDTTKVKSKPKKS